MTAIRALQLVNLENKHRTVDWILDRTLDWTLDLTLLNEVNIQLIILLLTISIYLLTSGEIFRQVLRIHFLKSHY